MHSFKKTLPLLVAVGLVPLGSWAQGSTIEVDYRQPAKPLNVFWNSTGFSPADAVAAPEMKQVLRDIGELPERGLKYIRPHYLLNLAVAEGMATGKPTYDWSRLDRVLDEITLNKLKLIFELMGLPSDGTDKRESRYDKNFQAQLERRKSYFDNLRNRDQIQNWKIFVTALAEHLESRYGRDEVRTWLFETTNEPDGPHWWEYDIPTFMNYYDACSEGLKTADAALQFGGPCTQSRPTFADIFDALLDHCDTGKNYFTGETGVRIDFISFHVKDLPQNMISRELGIYERIKTRHPKFAGKPLINDESDPIRAWATPFWWQEGPWYAAYVVQSIDLHQQLVIDRAGANYRLFSSDHAFMGEWNQRTTHTLFRDQPNSDGFVLIKKPVLTVMEMVAKLGRQYVDVEIPKGISAYFGIIPSNDGDALSLLVYNKTAIEIGPDPRMTPGAEQKPGANMSVPPKPVPDVEVALMAQQHVKAQLKISGIKGTHATLQEFLIDETHGNPHHEWVEMGKPTVLSADQLARLKAAEHPALVRSQKIECPNGQYVYQLAASSPSVSLITIVPEKISKP